MFHGFVFKHLTHNPTISTPYNEDIFGIRMARKWDMRNHLLVPLMKLETDLEHWSRVGTNENSSRSVHWITPSRTRTFPYV